MAAFYALREQSNRVAAQLQSFYENKDFCDVTLIAGLDDFRVEAHRMVLCAASEYFRSMFHSNLREARAREIKLEDWEGEILKTIIDFMYMPSIDLRSDNIERMLEAADFFQMDTLRDFCCDFMIKELDLANCLHTVFFAEQHNYAELCGAALMFTCKNFDRVCTGPEFLEMNAELLSRFLRMDDICVPSEKSVLRSLVAWIKHDIENRSPMVFELLQHIRYPLLDPQCILKSRRYLCPNSQCQGVVMDWLQYLLLPETRDEFPQAVTNRRKSSNKIYYLSGWDAELKVQTYDSEVNNWAVVKWPHPMKRRKFFGTAVVDKLLMVGGGAVGGDTANCVECLDLQTMRWSMLPSMGIAKRWLAMAELDGFLYAMGGIDTLWSKTVIKFNLKTRTWQKVAPLSRGLMYVQAVALDGLLYAVCSENRFLECYDPVANKWTRLPNKKDISAQFGLGAVGGCLYTVGGHCNEMRSKAVERYDPKTEMWTDAAPLSVGRSRITITTLNNKLVAAGGHDGENWSKIVEEYDPELDVWTPLAPLLSVGDSCSHLITV